MKKLSFALMCMASLALLTACGGGSSKGGDTTDSGNAADATGLADGKWPASVYDKYGIDEIKTNGKLVYTAFATDGSNQYEVFYKGVTKDEVLAYVNALKAKGFRISARDQKILEERSWEHVTLYQADEKKDVCLRIFFNYKENETMEYYADEPNPAFDIQEEGDQMFISYNFRVMLNPIENEAKSNGKMDALGIAAADFAGIPSVRVVDLNEGANGGSIQLNFFRDHETTAEDIAALHSKVAEVLAAKGAKFSHVFSGKELTTESLKAENIRSYMVEREGKKFLLMPNSDTEPGDFGGGVSFNFTLSRN